MYQCHETMHVFSYDVLLLIVQQCTFITLIIYVAHLRSYM